MISKKHRLLIIDDDTDITELLELLLCDHFELTTCSDPNLAIQLLSSEIFSVVLTDLKMPGMSGKQLIERVRETGSTVPIVVMTGFSESDP